jgi:D-alanyl-D-alanine carboxypeptidase
MQSERIPGLSLGVARAGVFLYVRGYGFRDVAERLPAGARTIYRIGSLGKQFTAALVVQDAGAGRIALDAPVSRYLGATPLTASVRQLLLQTSGIAEPAGEDADTPQAALHEILSQPPAAEPGASWTYSNANYLLLQAVLERIDGMPYATLLQERLLTPLQLTSVTYGAMPAAGDVAAGYAAALPPHAMSDPPNVFAAGSACANAVGLLRWLEALRAGRAAGAGGVAAMTASGTLPDGMLTGYGLGFFLPNWYGYRVAEHPGYAGGFSALDALVLDDGLELAVLANREAVDLTPLAKSVLLAVDGARDPNLAATPQQPPENENPRITEEIAAVARTPAFARFGQLFTVEFVERTRRDGIAYDTYRVTFSSGPWLVTAGYRDDGRLESLSFSSAR